MRAPVLFMLLSVFAYSLFPIIGAVVIDRVPAFLFIGLSHGAAFIALALVFIGLTSAAAPGRFDRRRIVAGARAELIPILFSGVVNAASHALLFQSFVYINKAAATIIYEIWPILVVLLIQRMMAGVYQRAGVTDYLLGLMAFSGLVIVTVSQPSVTNAIQSDAIGSLAGLFEQDLLLGLACALGAAVTMAVSTALDVKINRRFEGAMPFTASPVFAQTLIKIPSTLGALAIFALLNAAAGESDPGFGALVAGISAVDWGLALATGAGVIALGAVSYHWANAATASPMINVLWYLTPVLSLIWFAQFGLAEITPAIAVGAIMIIAANLLLSVKAERSAAYAATVVALALTAVYTFFVPGLGYEDYLELLAVVTGFYAILAAFLLDRLAKKGAELEDLILKTFEIMDETERLDPARKIALQRQVIDFADRRVDRRSLQPLLETADALSARGSITLEYALRRIALAKLNLFAFSEMMVLWLLGGFAVAAAAVFRTDELVGDLTAVVLGCAVVFLSTSVADQANYVSTKALRDLGAARHSEPDADAPHRLESQARPIVSVLMLVAIFIGYVLAAAEKHGYAPPL